MFDLIIIGAGPAGISAAYEAKKHNLDYLVLEKGLIGNTIYNYPVGLTVFSTTHELEFHKGDLKPARRKPTREELLSYYVRFVLENELNIQTEETVRCVVQSSPPYEGGVAAASADGVVLSMPTKKENHPPDKAVPRSSRKEESFIVQTDKATYEAKTVLFAIGAMEIPRKLGVKGEELPKVHASFRETYPWVKKRALVVGGGNSAGEAALFLAEEGADATLAIYREDWENTDPKHGCIKYWVKQPLENELQKGCLNLFFLGKILEIRDEEVLLEDENGETAALPNDVVFVLIGSDADLSMLKALGVKTEQGKNGEVPVYDEKTFETNIPGIYVAGHFTHARHIKDAIAVPRKIIPQIAERLT